MRFATVMILTLAFLLTGCSSTNIADLVAAMGDNPATVSIRVNTIYGTIMFCRTAILNGDVSCNGDGITVKSETASVGVPLTVVPSVTIGAPTLAPAR